MDDTRYAIYWNEDTIHGLLEAIQTDDVEAEIQLYMMWNEMIERLHEEGIRYVG